MPRQRPDPFRHVRLRNESVWERPVHRRTELHDLRSSGCPPDEPRRTRRAEHGRVELPVAVVISRRDDVAGRLEREAEKREVFAPHDEPLPGGRAPDCDICCPVAGVVALNGFVRVRPELHREQPRGAAVDPPLPATRDGSEDRHICFVVAVAISRDRLVSAYAELLDAGRGPARLRDEPGRV